jgi:hypothetical protein
MRALAHEYSMLSLVEVHTCPCPCPCPCWLTVISIDSTRQWRDGHLMHGAASMRVCRDLALALLYNSASTGFTWK